jgi:NAD(P)-dependent dehydrogenase (short-subunit alcohol dehydrogenase family)
MSRQQTVLITGATAGIGRRTALYLWERGFHVIATGRRASALDELCLEAGKDRFSTLVLDVTDPDAITNARGFVDQLTDGYGLDVLVNNAAYGQGGPLELVPDDMLRRQFDTNVFGLMAVVRAFLPAMRERGSGRIINISSIAGKLVAPFLGVYDATKFAVEGLSDALRRELRPFGVLVVLVEPGAIRTDFDVIEREGLRAYCGPGSPYSAYLEPFITWHERIHRRAPDPLVVARTIERAITARRPRSRYVTPLSTRVLLLLNGLLPTLWTDALVGRIVGMGGEKHLDERRNQD